MGGAGGRVGEWMKNCARFAMPRGCACLQAVPWPASWLKAPSNTAKGFGTWRAREAGWIFCPEPLDPGHNGNGWVARERANPVVKGKRKHGEVWVPWAMADNGRRGKMMDKSTPQGAWAAAHEPPSVYANRLQREKVASKKAAAHAAATPQQAVFVYPKDDFGRKRIATVEGLQSSFARSQAHYDQSRVVAGLPTLLESTSGRASNVHRADEPRLTNVNARRIEHYEAHLQQMRLVYCQRCDCRLLVLNASSDVFGPNGCSVCERDGKRYAVFNCMNPAPSNRLEQALRAAKADAKRNLPLPMLRHPPGARYPPCFYEASLVEELLVTRFRTVMSIRHMPLKHRKYRGHTISFYQAVGNFADMFSDMLPVPLTLNKVAIWIVRTQLHQGSKFQDYRVRRDLVAELLRWLPILLPNLYWDVNLRTGQGVDNDALKQLPADDSVFDELPSSEYSAADASGSASASLSASANGPVMSEYVSGSELDMDRSGFVGKPPMARNYDIAQRAVEHVLGSNKHGQPVLGFPKAHTEGECEWNQCECPLPSPLLLHPTCTLHVGCTNFCMRLLFYSHFPPQITWWVHSLCSIQPKTLTSTCLVP